MTDRQTKLVQALLTSAHLRELLRKKIELLEQLDRVCAGEIAKMEGLEFSYDKVKQLRRAYNEACTAKVETFMFDGHELVLAYAYYLIEYLSNQFSITQPPVKHYTAV